MSVPLPVALLLSLSHLWSPQGQAPEECWHIEVYGLRCRPHSEGSRYERGTKGVRKGGLHASSSAKRGLVQVKQWASCVFCMRFERGLVNGSCHFQACVCDKMTIGAWMWRRIWRRRRGDCCLSHVLTPRSPPSTCSSYSTSSPVLVDHGTT